MTDDRSQDVVAGRRLFRVAVTVVILGLVAYAVVAWLVPIGWIGTLVSLPQYLYGRFAHVPGLNQSLKDAPAVIEADKQLLDQLRARGVDLREQAKAAQAALAQAKAARAQADALKLQIEAAGKELGPLREKNARLELEVKRHADRLAELDAAAATARAAPVQKVTTAREAAEALRGLGY